MTAGGGTDFDLYEKARQALKMASAREKASACAAGRKLRGLARWQTGAGALPGV